MKQTTIIIIALVMLLSGCSEAMKQKEKKTELSEADKVLIEKANRFFATLPEPGDPNTPLALLGKKLYFEEAISANGKMSCNTCHPIATYGVDNLPVSPGFDGTPGTRNSPTTFNAWFHTAQFWDGRSPDLADQAKGPVLNPVEMGLSTGEEVEAILAGIPEYYEMFSTAFPDEDRPITFDNFALALEAFQGTLATQAAFDEFLDGAVNQLTAVQKEGLAIFMDAGCIACHTGPGLGGNNMHRFGLVHGPYYEFTGSQRPDRGVADITGVETDQYVFKTPSLRNIEKTAPYFHDGSVESLAEATRIMAYVQLGKELSDEEIGKIVEFYKSLTGEIPEHAL
ncbi:MAG: cytochrome c peroxidase [Bacteroidales bacterium]|jgi:cytochrome c peroxidase